MTVSNPQAIDQADKLDATIFQVIRELQRHHKPAGSFRVDPLAAAILATTVTFYLTHDVHYSRAATLLRRLHGDVQIAAAIQVVLSRLDVIEAALPVPELSLGESNGFVTLELQPVPQVSRLDRAAEPSCNADR